MKKLLLSITTLFISLTFIYSQTNINIAKASYYHSKFNGRKTATGDTYWDHLATAASNIYKLGTRLLVTNKNTGKSVEVVVNDRMAQHIKGRVDLSKSAFRKIASTEGGLVPVTIEILDAKKVNNNTI